MKKHVSSDILWDEIAASLSELSRRDSVDYKVYRIRATEESVNKKLKGLEELIND